jgi:hypothetical protein
MNMVKVMFDIEMLRMNTLIHFDLFVALRDLSLNPSVNLESKIMQFLIVFIPIKIIHRISEKNEHNSWLVWIIRIKNSLRMS